MNLCKNCMQEYSQPQFNEKGQAICPVKNCGADHPENLAWADVKKRDKIKDKSRVRK